MFRRIVVVLIILFFLLLPFLVVWFFPGAEKILPFELPGIAKVKEDLNFSGNVSNMGFVAFDEDKLFYSNTWGIFCVTGDDSVKILDDYAQYMVVVDDRIYYENLSDYGKLYSVRTDGADRLALTDFAVTNVMAGQDGVYFISPDDLSSLYRLDTEEGFYQLLSDDDMFLSAVVGGNKLYYSSGNDGCYLYCFDLKEKRKTWLVDHVVQKIVVYGGEVYYSRIDKDEGVYRIGSDGVPERIVSGAVSAFNIFNDKLYYCTNGVYECNLDGSEKIFLVDAPSVSICVGANSLFYIDGIEFVLYKYDLVTKEITIFS